jgi:opine dehydrogenase
MAAMMAARGHAVSLWSPRGGGTRQLGSKIATRGALEGRWSIHVAADLWRAAELSELILVALPEQAMLPILQRLSGALIGAPDILFAPAGGLAPALLHQLMVARGIAPRIGAMPVLPLMAKRDPDGVVAITGLRHRLWLGGWPREAAPGLMALAEGLFGLPVEPLDDVLAAALAEPGALIGVARRFAPAGLPHGLGRLLLALAAERDAIAASLNRTGLPGIAALVTEGGGLPDPPRPLIETGLGLAFLDAMARQGETAAPLITGALGLLEAAAGERFGPHPVLAALEPGSWAGVLG